MVYVTRQAAGSGQTIKPQKSGIEGLLEQSLGQAQYDLSAILAADIMAYQDNRPSEEQEKRLVEAYMWLVLADAQGHSQASNAITRIKAHMSSGQIAKAQKLAAEWMEWMEKHK